VTTSSDSGSRTSRAAIAAVLAFALLGAFGAVEAAAAPLEAADASRSSWPHGTAVVGFRSDRALDAALRRLGAAPLSSPR
jgi:hypothetical protein